MLIATIPCLAAVVGLLVYALASNPKTAEAGRLAFACGLLVALFVLEHEHAIKVLP
jgi:hypothetical protein